MSTALILRHRPRRFARGQRGVVMFVAMAVLIVMTLAGLAMLRQLGSSTGIAGNLAFKRGATSSADFGIEAARRWLTDPANSLTADATAASGATYFATWGSAAGALHENELDPTQGGWVDVWRNADEFIEPATGDRVRYVIQRLCKQTGAADAPGQDCAAAPGQIVNKGGPGTVPGPKPAPTPYYRVTAQVKGARNTVSYTQVVLGS